MPCFSTSGETCEKLCGYYKHFCPVYATAHNEIDTSESIDLED